MQHPNKMLEKAFQRVTVEVIENPGPIPKCNLIFLVEILPNPLIKLTQNGANFINVFIEHFAYSRKVIPKSERISSN